MRNAMFVIYSRRGGPWNLPHKQLCCLDAEWKLDARAPALMNEIHQEYVFTIDHTGKRNEWKRNRIDRRCAPMTRCLCIDGFPKLLIAVWTAEPDQRKCNHEFTPNVVKYVPDEYRCFAALVWFAYAKIIWFAVIRTMQVTKSCATKLGIYFKKMRWKYRCVRTSRSIAKNECIWDGNLSPSKQAMSTQTVTCHKTD